jgi:hypothetical protein
LRGSTGNAKFIPVILVAKGVEGIHCNGTVQVIAQNANLRTHLLWRHVRVALIHIRTNPVHFLMTGDTRTFVASCGILTDGVGATELRGNHTFVDVQTRGQSRLVSARESGIADHFTRLAFIHIDAGVSLLSKAQRTRAPSHLIGRKSRVALTERRQGICGGLFRAILVDHPIAIVVFRRVTIFLSR